MNLVLFEPMTIAVALKVQDGVVLAADSATTLSGPTGVVNVYNHANKIVNLRKGEPIGLMTWGMGGFAGKSIATLAKDFRAFHWPDRFANGAYTVEEVANEIRTYFVEVAGDLSGVPPEHRPFGVLLAGHSKRSDAVGEGWVVEVDPVTGTWNEPANVLGDDAGISWYGEVRWLQRLLLGVDFEAVARALVDRLGLPQDQLLGVVNTIRAEAAIPFIDSAMPIQDAINLAHFLVDVSVKAAEYRPGSQTVGGPIEIAAITKHEGFKWVRRKHYFDTSLNPTTGEVHS